MFQDKRASLTFPSTTDLYMNYVATRRMEVKKIVTTGVEEALHDTAMLPRQALASD